MTTQQAPTSSHHKKEDDSSTIGSGPLFRRTVIRRRVIRGNARKKKKKACCFNWLSIITCLITMEAIALVCLVFRSHTILIDPSLEEDAFHFLVWLDTTLGGGADHEELEQLEAWLVQRTEDRLDHGHLLEHEVETVALDNYYQREHFRVADVPQDQGTVLLVAELAGSGSRAVVDALLQLGVPVISMERPPPDTTSELEKKNFHSGQIAWREMINIVLQSGLHTCDYEFQQLPKFSQLRIRQEWEKLYQGYISKQLPDIAHHGELQYGFHAHDALFLLPVFQEFMTGPLKVLHLVRDGRDVALLNSKPFTGKDNKEHPRHSMAERFVLETHYEVRNATQSSSYDDHHLTPKEQSIVRSMELWNDWNRDSWQWLERHNQNNPQLDYLQLRAEDLLSPEKKLEALLQMSHFVVGGSPTIPMFHQLCCLSRQALVVEKSSDYLKRFSQAKSQHKVLNQYSAQLSFFHQQEDEDRRKARLGDLFPRRRHPGPAAVPDVRDEVRDQVHDHRTHRFQDIGERLAERLPANPAEGRRRLEEEEEEEGGTSTGGTGRIKSPEVKAMFQQYFSWRKSLSKARDDPEAATAAMTKGQKLLAEFHKHQEHLKGVLTEDSFTRSIEWLKNLHNTKTAAPIPKNHISQRYGKWAQLLREQPQLAHRLNAVGNETLQVFGYEPHARFIDFDPENQKAQCHVDVVCK